MTTAPTRTMTYLLVEDNDDHATIIEKCLRHGDQAHRIHRVKGGTGCLNYLSGDDEFADREQYPYPDVVLLDIRMPGTLDGLQTLKAIRSDPRRRSLVVMMLTTSDRDTDVNRAYELGANGYIVKSEDTAEMIDRLLQMHWSFTGLVQLPAQKHESNVGSQQEPDARTPLPSKLKPFLQRDEDAALNLLASYYSQYHDDFLELLDRLERVDSSRFASLVYRFCIDWRHLFIRRANVDWVFLRKVVMDKLPKYTAPEKMAGMVPGIAAALEGKVWEGGPPASWHAWQGFCQAYLNQTAYSTSEPTEPTSDAPP